MADTIKFKRGVKSKLNTLAYGEPAYISDENELYIGTEDGVEKITRNKEVAELSSQLEQIENKTYTTYLIKNSEWGISSGFTNSISTTDGINNAIKYAKDKGYSKVVFEKGNYLIHCDDNTTNYTKPKGGIILHSDIEYDLNGSTFKIIDNMYLGYAIFNIENISNIVIKNGILVGDRPRHDYTTKSGTHEFGYGVFILGGHNIDVLNNTMYDFTGDCICIMCSQEWSNEAGANIRYRNSERINVIGNDLSHSRRQGISVCSAEDINIKNNVIHHIGITEDGIEGTAPQFGIDLEGYTGIESINRCIIENNHFNNNLRADIYCASRVEHVVIRNNTCIRANDDTYVNAIADGGNLNNDTATKHCIIDGNYIENGGIKGGAWNLFIVNNTIKCVGGNYGIDARYHKIVNGEGGIITINNNQIETGSIRLMHCNFASVTNNILNNSKDVIDFGIHHNQIANITLNNPSKSSITGNIINGNYNMPVGAYSFDPTIVNISDCKFDTTGLMASGYLKNCMIKLTRDSDCNETYNPFKLDNCTIYYNGYRILYCWTDQECLITNCSFYNTDNTKTKSIITYGGKNPQFTITNNYFYNCNDSVVINRTKNKCILVNNYFEKVSSVLKDVISNPWDATGEEVSIYKNNVAINFNEVNK